MDQLINSLPALLRAAGDTDEIKETAAFVAWNNVAGEGLRRQTVPIRLQQSRLTVAVADAIWKRQLESMGAQLLFRMNSLLGQGVVSFIEFQVDPAQIESVWARQAAKQDLRAEPDLAIPFELVSAAAAIRDNALRKAFIRAAMSCARRMAKGEDL